MVALSFWQKALLVVLCLAAINTQICSAQLFLKDPTKWWPDPSTGLMWAEHGFTGKTHGWGQHALTWQESVDYCAALKLGGFTGWRIPTLDEVKGIGYTRHGVVTMSYFGCCATGTPSDPHDQLTIKVAEWDVNAYPFATNVWTSTPTPEADKPAKWIAGPTVWIVGPELLLGAIPKTWDGSVTGFAMAALCVRPIDADLLQITKDAQIGVPVPDIETLKAYVPLNKARLAFEAGQYQDSITQARNALSIDPRLQTTDLRKTAYWGMGISYGMLGQWDLSIANLNSAFKLDKNYQGDVYSALKWAKASKKAAKKGEKPMIKGKEWQSPEWKAPWS